MVGPFILGFLLSASLMPFYIKWLKHLRVGQFIRQEGPASHLVKANTPTSGGVVIALSSIICTVLLLFGMSPLTCGPKTCWWLIPVSTLGLAVCCGILGAADDFSKLLNKANKGLPARLRLIIELALGLIFGLVVFITHPDIAEISLLHHTLHLPFLVFVVLCAFLVSACTNAVNLHDGMDGLAAGTSMLIFITIAAMFHHPHNFSGALEASYAGVIGGFLLFNRYPAKIFMGDTGSLFIGGLLAGTVLTSGLLIWFIPLSLIYIAETLSVMAQVSYFKLTKPHPGSALYKLTHKLPGEGKRLFRMAPLHHHFEAIFAEKGIPEWQVVLGFWLIQLVLCLLVLAVFFTF